MNSVDLRVDKRLCTKTRRTANQIISTNEIYWANFDRDLFIIGKYIKFRKVL